MAHRLLSFQFTRPVIIPCITHRITTSPLRPIHTTRRLRQERDDRAGDPLFRPSPPPLPAAEQREFEELVRRAATGKSTPAPATRMGQPEEASLHPDYRRKPPNEFEGDVNPKTGEIGGPKREPIRHNDWSYGGRATDF